MNEIFKIVKDTNKSIREKSSNIDLPLSTEIEQLGLEMLQYLKNSQDEEFLEKHPEVRSGVGLAAPQIGKNIKLIAVYFNDGKKDIEYVLVNPKIVAESAQKCYLSSGEGCLSVPENHEGYVYRHFRIKVKAYNILTKKDEVIDARGYLSIVLQHEIDHLSGILYYDRINNFEPFKVLSGAIEL
jgi:peptide deformylase